MPETCPRCRTRHASKADTDLCVIIGILDGLAAAAHDEADRDD